MNKKGDKYLFVFENQYHSQYLESHFQSSGNQKNIRNLCIHYVREAAKQERNYLSSILDWKRTKDSRFRSPHPFSYFFTILIFSSTIYESRILTSLCLLGKGVKTQAPNLRWAKVFTWLCSLSSKWVQLTRVTKIRTSMCSNLHHPLDASCSVKLRSLIRK